MHATEYTDMSINVSRVLLKLTGNWVTMNDTEKRHRVLAMSYTIVALVYGVYVNVVDVYHSLDDLDHCIFLICNTLNIILAMYKMLVVNVYRMEYVNLILDARQHFWHLNYNADESELFIECQKVCKLWTILICSLTQASLCFYIIRPISVNIGSNKSEKVLPFKMWVDLPLTVSPYYEIMFAVQLLAVQQIGISYICNENFFCLLNLHMVYQFRMLQYKLRKFWLKINEQTDIIAYTSRCHTELKKCIEQHQSLIRFSDRIETIYTLPILGHVVVFSMLMCFDSYEIILADVSTSTRLIFIFHMVGSFMHLIFFTYICNGLIEESTNISIATYSGWWTILPMTEAGRMLRKDVRTIIMKSMRPCYMSAGGFFPVSLQTSTALISSTMSYFTLMRQSSMKVTDE
ncbi:PREDICTED: odorant receptor 30a-like [Eufriesea mexicana]|uniref:odorant receptor 30a-like n=1 Tax=Eufriesea mexicana TaxID=516756 RepID=UPI00083BBBA3|nr:PREDICTED: odorant receptor 30a-like [Eufriesea mexicana]